MKLLNPFRRRARQQEPPPYSVVSFSQEGEDRVLARLFEGQSRGCYVDVGAHHPQRFSNTYLFYLQGWRGLNIDAAPGVRDLFDQHRPGDINLELAVGARTVRPYYRFEETALNGFDAALTEERRHQGHAVLAEAEMPTVPLAEVLDTYLPQGTRIDFLTVDVEGLDLEVLRSNDWARHRPTLVLAEERDVRDLSALSPVAAYMAEQGYAPIARTFNTWIFRTFVDRPLPN